MSLEPHGQQLIARALAGQVGLTGPDGTDIPGFGRQDATLDQARELTFGPARQPVIISGVALYQHNVRLLDTPLEKPVRLRAGQRLKVQVALDTTAP